MVLGLVPQDPKGLIWTPAHWHCALDLRLESAWEMLSAYRISVYSINLMRPLPVYDGGRLKGPFVSRRSGSVALPFEVSEAESDLENPTELASRLLIPRYFREGGLDGNEAFHADPIGFAVEVLFPLCLRAGISAEYLRGALPVLAKNQQILGCRLLMDEWVGAETNPDFYRWLNALRFVRDVKKGYGAVSIAELANNDLRIREAVINHYRFWRLFGRLKLIESGFAVLSLPLVDEVASFLIGGSTFFVGCSAEVSTRLMESAFLSFYRDRPDSVPAFTENLALQLFDADPRAHVAPQANAGAGAP